MVTAAKSPVCLSVSPPTVILHPHKLRGGSSPAAGLLWTLFTSNSLPHYLKFNHHSPRSISISSSSATTTTELPRLRRQKIREPENDAISTLNERIRREQGKREATRKASSSSMDSEEANKYIQMVKEQQQRGLDKLKGQREGKHGGGGGGGFSYKVDPYTLQPGDYVVHKKVGIGRFAGIKYDVPKDSAVSIEYVFIEYADGMAKLPVKQAARFLYRYNL